MKIVHALACFSLIFLLMLASCSKNSSEPEFISPVAPLVGIWDLTEYKFISKSNPGVIADMLELVDLSVTMIIKPNGNYTVTVILDSDTTVETGTFTDMEDFENETTKGDSNVTVTLVGNTLTITMDNQNWDFGNGSEPALARIVYRRRE